MIQAGRYQGIELDPEEYTPRQARPFRQRPDSRFGRKMPGCGRVPCGFAGAICFASRTLRAGSSVVRRRRCRPDDRPRSGGEVRLHADPGAPAGTPPVAVDELRLSRIWTGEAVLLRAARSVATADWQFNLSWLVKLVLQERTALRDIAIASVTISILTIFPPVAGDGDGRQGPEFHSLFTLALLSGVMAIVVVYETLLGYARREIVAVVGARLDTKLSLHVFNRLLRLPLDYFERHPAGETMFRISGVYRVREFLTGKLLTTFLDAFVAFYGTLN